MSITVWGRYSAFNVQKVLWLLGELNLPFQHVPAGGTAGGLDTPEFLALNPLGRIPVIQDHHQQDSTIAVWESHSILRYLAAQYGHEQFWSHNAAVRSEADRWLDWFQTTLQPAFLNQVFVAYYRTPESQRDWTIINQGIERTSQLLNILEQQLNHKDFITGNTLSLADIAVGSLFYRYFNLGLHWPVLPNIANYYQRLIQRPAYQQYVAVPFNELYGQPG